MTTDSNKTTKTVIGAAIKGHRELGPGLLESAYQVCLVHELRRGIARLVNNLDENLPLRSLRSPR